MPRTGLKGKPVRVGSHSLRWRVNIRLIISRETALKSGGRLARQTIVKPCYPNKVTWSEFLKKTCHITANKRKWDVEAFRNRANRLRSPLTEKVSTILKEYKTNPAGCYLFYLVVKGSSACTDGTVPQTVTMPRTAPGRAAPVPRRAAPVPRRAAPVQRPQQQPVEGRVPILPDA